MASAQQMFPALFGEAKPSAADVARAKRMPPEAMRLLQYSMRQASKRLAEPASPRRRFS